MHLQYFNGKVLTAWLSIFGEGVYSAAPLYDVSQTILSSQYNNSNRSGKLSVCVAIDVEQGLEGESGWCGAAIMCYFIKLIIKFLMQLEYA